MTRVGVAGIGAALLGAWAALLVAAPAGAQIRPDLVISGGVDGGHYDAVAGRLRSLVTTEKRAYVEVLKSEGSMQNLARLDDAESPVGVALTQADALHHYLEQHPGFAGKYLVLADVGKECVFVVTGRKSALRSTADLASAGEGALSVGPPGSGAAVTWEYMGRLAPGLGGAQAVHVDVMEALLQIKLGRAASGVQAAMLVQRPRTLSPPIEVALQKREVFRFVPIRRGDLEASALPGGEPVYTFENVTLRYEGTPHRVDTVCTRGLLLGARAKLPDEIRSNLIEALLKSGEYLTPGAE